MIVRPDLQCESPYFHGLWYFYLMQTRFGIGNASQILVKALNDYFKSGLPLGLL